MMNNGRQLAAVRARNLEKWWKVENKSGRIMIKMIKTLYYF